MLAGVPLEDILFATLYPVLLLSITGVAWWICFRSAERRQSRGQFLVSLGFFAMLVIYGSWEIFYWLILGGTFEFVEFVQAGLSVDQVVPILTWTSWISTAVFSTSFALMAALVTYGTAKIIEEKSVSVVAP